MTRIMELFVIANALAGIATFLGVRLIYRRSRDKAKRGFDFISGDREDEETEIDDPRPEPPRSLVKGR